MIIVFWREKLLWEIKTRQHHVGNGARTPSNLRGRYSRQSRGLLDAPSANRRLRYCHPSASAVFNDVGLSATNKPSPLCNRHYSSLSRRGPSPLFHFHRSTAVRFCLLISSRPPLTRSKYLREFQNSTRAVPSALQLLRLHDVRLAVTTLTSFRFIFSSIRPGI